MNFVLHSILSVNNYYFDCTPTAVVKTRHIKIVHLYYIQVNSMLFLGGAIAFRIIGASIKIFLHAHDYKIPVVCMPHTTRTPVENREIEMLFVLYPVCAQCLFNESISCHN